MAVVYFLLIVGAVTTLYPFLIMLGTGFKGPIDQNDNKLIPGFWSDDAELLTKYRDDKYASDASWISHTQTGAEASEETIRLYEEFLLSLPPDQWLAGFKTPPNHVTSRLSKRWQAWLKTEYSSLDDVNAAFNEINGAFQQISPPPERLDSVGWEPKGDQKWKDWLEFKQTLPAEFRIPITERRVFQEWLRAKLQNQVGDIPAEFGAGLDSFEAVPLPTEGALLAEFRSSGLPVAFRESGSIEEQWSKLSPEPLPIEASEIHYLTQHKKPIRSEFTYRNYLYVLDYVLINGRAVVNTAIFCLLTILIQLTVNPLAAYALSRFPMKATGKILLFLLATMAFPAEVAMIPSFLLLKDLGLLNTFAALVLPTAASGYMIFLLKGFFDSLPQEVFESGQIDGAPEWKMMLRIAFPLSKPVFGYMALIAFMSSYGAFIFAFLVAQDRNMWTLMVFIYQLQLSAPKSVVMAAVTLAALPTLLVFLAAQRVIMRGIVLPGER